MTTSEIFEFIKTEMNAAPRNAYVAELHLQSIKWSEQLADINGREFCEGLGIGPSFGTEFTKMKKIASRLQGAGLDVSKI